MHHNKHHETDRNSKIKEIENKLVYIKWIPPTDSWCKLNIDGSVEPWLHTVDYDGVIKDHNSLFLGTFTTFLGDCSIMVTELRAILFGVIVVI
ncbi:hypothetical protein SESBI_44359 [Sesbania bispinosa]|nr:hypothetical protein SESBI_44359 [Sesbania bispinosa]